MSRSRRKHDLLPWQRRDARIGPIADAHNEARSELQRIVAMIADPSVDEATRAWCKEHVREYVTKEQATKDQLEAAIDRPF